MKLRLKLVQDPISWGTMGPSVSQTPSGHFSSGLVRYDLRQIWLVYPISGGAQLPWVLPILLVAYGVRLFCVLNLWAHRLRDKTEIF